MIFVYASGYGSDIFKMIFFGVPWTIGTCLFAYYITCVIYFINSYIFVISKVARIRLERITNALKSYRLATDSSFKRRKMGIVEAFEMNYLKDLNQLIYVLSEYNRFWRINLTIVTVFRLTIINFAAYLILIQNLGHIFFIQYCLVTTNELSSFIFYIFQAALVSFKSKLLREQMEYSAISLRDTAVIYKIKVKPKPKNQTYAKITKSLIFVPQFSLIDVKLY